MLDFQLGCIRLAVMSGVAGWPSFLVEEDKDNDDSVGGSDSLVEE